MCGRSTGCRTQGFSASFCKQLHYSQPQKAPPDNTSHRFLPGEASLTPRWLAQVKRFSGLPGVTEIQLGLFEVVVFNSYLAKGGGSVEGEERGNSSMKRQ